MDLADFMESNKDRLIDRWMELAEERLGFNLESSELLNHLPRFLDEIILTLRDPTGRWPALEGAQSHGRHRLRAGVDIGALTEEMLLVIESVCSACDADGASLDTSDLLTLTHVVGRGTAHSVTAYAAIRDEDLASQARDHFSFIAHELRTPLQTAQFAAALLASGPENQRDRYLRLLRHSLGRVGDMIDNSLIEVRLAERPPMRLEMLGSSELMDIVSGDVVDQAEVKGVALSGEVEAFEVEGDRKLLVSALTNLMKNAVKFTPAGGRVVLRGEAREDRALFEIEDECGGMPDDLPAQLFQPHLQHHDDRSGFGLGLMIVKQAVEAHGGAVRINNRPGDGCSFVIDLPLTQGNGIPEDQEAVRVGAGG